MGLQQTSTIDASGNLVISGTVTSNAGSGTQAVSIASMPSTPVTGTFFQGTQPVSIATAPVLVAGSAIIGKVGIDQSTPGTTNGVQVNAALPSGTNVIGHVIVDASSAVIGHVIVDSGSITTTAATSATGTITSAAGSVTSVTVLASNASRKGFTIFNDSTAILKIAFAAAASATSFTALLQPNSFYENSTLYTGIITGIWASAAGNARVTELT